MGLRERPGWLEVYSEVLPTADFSVEVSWTVGCVKFKSVIVLIITAVFPS